MEIPVIESGIARFQSPNLLVYLRSLWTWAALIVAAVATFNSLIRRCKRVILRFRRGRSVITHPASSTYYDSDGDDVSFSSSNEGEDDEAAAEEEDGDDEVDSVSEKDFRDFEGEIHGQNGKSDQHFDWQELARDGSVVKLWDGLGLGFDCSKGSMSLLDLKRDDIIRSFRCESDEPPAVHVSSPATFVSARNGGLKVWDARTAGRAAADATWQAEGQARLVGIVGGKNNDVYVSDDVGKLTVVDLRSVRSPLAVAAWWRDGGATLGDGGDGLVSWCKNAAKSFTRL